MRLALGSAVRCADGEAGVLADLVVDPRARRVTHLVVEPRHRHVLALPDPDYPGLGWNPGDGEPRVERRSRRSSAWIPTRSCCD
jgi:hypothetical protein